MREILDTFHPDREVDAFQVVSDGRRVTVSISVAWWFRWYAAALAFFCRTHGLMPDQEKLKRVIARAMVARIKRG